jgi:preprotein translocase subunit SecG
VDRLHGLLQRHGSEVLLQAVEQGLQDQVFSARYVERFLQRSLTFAEVVK